MYVYIHAWGLLMRGEIPQSWVAWSWTHLWKHLGLVWYWKLKPDNNQVYWFTSRYFWCPKKTDAMTTFSHVGTIAYSVGVWEGEQSASCFNAVWGKSISVPEEGTGCRCSLKMCSSLPLVSWRGIQQKGRECGAQSFTSSILYKCSLKAERFLYAE